MADDVKVERTGDVEESTSSGRSKTWLWMIAALVVVGGFLVWLGAASEPSTVAVVDVEQEDEEDLLSSGATSVAKDSLADYKGLFEGQLIQVADVEMTGELGPRIFWGELGTTSDQKPILVRLDSVAAEDLTLQRGAAYTLTGELLPMSDSVAAGWGEAGEFRGEGEEMQAAFTDYYIQASRIRQSREASPDEGSGDGNGSDDTES